MKRPCNWRRYATFVVAFSVVRGRLLTALVVALAAAPPASTGDVDRGEPRDLRIARPSDLRERPGAPYEEWLIRAVNPRTRHVVSIDIVRDPESDDLTANAASIPVGGPNVYSGFNWDRGAADAPTWRDDRSILRLARARGGWTLTASGPSLEGRLRIRHARAGGAATRWRFGHEAREGRRHLSWAAPVARGVASGTFAIRAWGDDAQVTMRGWRVSIEHWWGAFSRESKAYLAWRTHVVHQRGGVTWSLVGATRRNLVTEPGPANALWAGVLARTDANDTTMCRPRIRTRSADYVDGRSITGAIRARCGRRSVMIEEVLGSAIGYDLPLFSIGEGARVSARAGVGYGRSTWPCSRC